MDATLLDIVVRAIDETNRRRQRQIDKSDVGSVRLYGTDAVFDSMQLVNFLTLVEQMLDDELQVPVSLTSEKAVSMRVSPFSSVRTLVAFIESELAEQRLAASA